MTYSLVARDPTTGQLGVAVQSHWFSVGSVVPWARSGVGAVATQAMADPSYGPLALELLAAGRSAPQALPGLVVADPDAAIRQVGVVDAAGRVATHTGSSCIAEAGHVSGDGWTAQANMMAEAGVPEAMGDAFEGSSEAPFPERLLLALEAAEEAGGDVRGRQSAAVLVVAGQPSGRPWADRVVDVRVDDHPDPLGEVRRLVSLSLAYARANEAEQLLADDPSRALAEYEAAVAVAGRSGNPELGFWAGVALAGAGHLEEAGQALAGPLSLHPGWRALLQRLPAAGLLPDDPGLMATLLGEGRPR